MNNLNWEFFEVYKKLDELCKQTLLSDTGISEYIAQMECDDQGKRLVVCWETDYKQLKKMRWIRNKLAHEANSFQNDLVIPEDIEWLNTFYIRILECTDPFALLHQTRNTKKQLDVKRAPQKEGSNHPIYLKQLIPELKTREANLDKHSSGAIWRVTEIIAIGVGVLALIGGMVAIIIFIYLLV